MAYFSPLGNGFAFVDSNGNPLSGALLFTYIAGSSTKQTTYKNEGSSSSHTNPIVLDSNGRAPDPIWLTAGVSYKFVLAPSNDTDPPASPIETWDDIDGVNDTSVSVDQWVSGPAPTFVSTTSFTLVGDQTSTFHAGRRLKLTDSGGTDYATIVASAYGALTTVTVSVDAGGVLDAGLSAVSYGLISSSNTSVPGVIPNDGCNGRLTLTTAVPVTTSDVTAATTLYFTPYKGNRISLYDGTNWGMFLFSELSIAVPATTSQMYDVFCYNNAGTLTLELTAWTNDTTRATALTFQNGVYVKTGVTTRRYLGSFRTTGVSGQTEDSAAKRYVYNYYNRVRRQLKAATETTANWNYTTDTFRQANANTANQLDVVVGVSEDMIAVDVVSTAGNSTANIVRCSGIGVDSTSADSSIFRGGQASGSAANTYQVATAHYEAIPAVGRHYYAWLERSSAVGTAIWFGGNSAYIQSGISGSFQM